MPQPPGKPGPCTRRALPVSALPQVHATASPNKPWSIPLELRPGPRYQNTVVEEERASAASLPSSYVQRLFPVLPLASAESLFSQNILHRSASPCCSNRNTPGCMSCISIYSLLNVLLEFFLQNLLVCTTGL